jgi:hypothetical protein
MQEVYPTMDTDKQKKFSDMTEEEKGEIILDMLVETQRRVHASMTLTRISDESLYIAHQKGFTIERLSEKSGVDKEFIDKFDRHKFSKDLLDLVVMLHTLNLTLDIRRCDPAKHDFL